MGLPHVDMSLTRRMTSWKATPFLLRATKAFAGSITFAKAVAAGVIVGVDRNGDDIRIMINRRGEIVDIQLE